MIFNSFIALTISLILIFMNSTISKKNFFEREKPSSFECGFDPKSPARIPFSLRFYLIAVIFLIFDVELTLLLPIPLIKEISNFFSCFTLILILMAILIMSLFHEWNQGALNWS